VRAGAHARRRHRRPAFTHLATACAPAALPAPARHPTATHSLPAVRRCRCELAVIAHFAVLRTRPSTNSAAHTWQLPLRQLGQS
jgi:hypothetical protein